RGHWVVQTEQPEIGARAVSAVVRIAVADGADAVAFAARYRRATGGAGLEMGPAGLLDVVACGVCGRGGPSPARAEMARSMAPLARTKDPGSRDDQGGVRLISRLAWCWPAW